MDLELREIEIECDRGTFLKSQVQQHIPRIPVLGAEMGGFSGVAGQPF